MNSLKKDALHLLTVATNQFACDRMIKAALLMRTSIPLFRQL